MHNDPTIFCRVCGLKQPYPQYGENGATPTYEHCECCGVEFGYQDCTVSSALKYRQEWINNGKKWDSPKTKPQNWTWGTQRLSIPKAFV